MATQRQKNKIRIKKPSGTWRTRQGPRQPGQTGDMAFSASTYLCNSHVACCVPILPLPGLRHVMGRPQAASKAASPHDGLPGETQGRPDVEGKRTIPIPGTAVAPAHAGSALLACCAALFPPKDTQYGRQGSRPRYCTGRIQRHVHRSRPEQGSRWHGKGGRVCDMDDSSLSLSLLLSLPHTVGMSCASPETTARGQVRSNCQRQTPTPALNTRARPGPCPSSPRAQSPQVALSLSLSVSPVAQSSAAHLAMFPPHLPPQGLRAYCLRCLVLLFSCIASPVGSSMAPRLTKQSPRPVFGNLEFFLPGSRILAHTHAPRAKNNLDGCLVLYSRVYTAGRSWPCRILPALPCLVQPPT